MILIIVESPAKCKKIEGFLGKNYKCVASFGHFREFTNGLKSIDSNYNAEYKVSHNKKKYVNIMRAAIKKSNEVILATDDDREGEAIAWHICKLFNLPIKTTKRIIFHEITKIAILDAMDNPTVLDMNEVRAQQARQILDLIVGFTVSPILWKYISKNSEKGLSAGRCQTPALNLVYENDLLCKNAKGEVVYETKGSFTFLNINYKLNRNFVEKVVVEDFLEKTKEHKHILSLDTKKRVKKSSPNPFTTSTLQQKASNVHNFSPKTTMRLAQKLYENGYITYMRTDNARYSSEFVENTTNYILQKWNKKYIGSDLNKITINSETDSRKNDINNANVKDNLAQEAHEAIRPTDIMKEFVENPQIGDLEKKLYKLIWSNSIESCMSSSIYDILMSSVTAPLNLKYKNSCEKNIFPGWEIVKGVVKDDTIYEYVNSLEESKLIVYREIRSEINIKKLKSHYTEAKLVQMLEKNGIGRPSTFSSLVSKIVERDYVRKMDVIGSTIDCENLVLKDEEVTEENVTKSFGDEKNKLVVQPVGIVVVEFLNKYFDNIFNYNYTKNMEMNLDKISKGAYKLKKLCGECKKSIETSIKNISTGGTENGDKCKNNNSGENKMSEKGIRIDSTHKWIVGKYGPVIICEEGGKVTFKKVKTDIDMERLKRGDYELKDILLGVSTKTLGQINNENVVLHNGKFGIYFSYKGKNTSLKNTDKKLEEITIKDVENALLRAPTNSTILKKIGEFASVRQGKFGPYVYYKTDEMNKPLFISLKKKAWKDIDMNWVLDNV